MTQDRIKYWRLVIKIEAHGEACEVKFGRPRFSYAFLSSLSCVKQTLKALFMYFFHG